jgi:hypothetical protein
LIAWPASIACAIACGEQSAASVQATKPPALGPLELPVSLRAQDPAPSDFYEVEITPSELRVGREVVLALHNGRVPAGERDAATLPKLTAIFKQTPRARLALSAHAMLAYETFSLTLGSAAAAGIHQLSVQVRSPGGGVSTGWLSPAGFQLGPGTSVSPAGQAARHDDVAFADLPARNWDEFTAAWETMHGACAAKSQTGGCGYVNPSVARGGRLKLVLRAKGQGVNLEFFRVGLTPEQLAREEKQRKQSLSAHKEDFMQGRMVKTDLEKELLEGPPASEASFQFRAEEALTSPSALSAVLAPLCGSRRCGALVSADPITPIVRVISLIGAAFPDSAAAPVLAFEMAQAAPSAK